MISLSAVTKVYKTGRTVVEALRGVSLEIPRGVLAVVMGPSGSGKSTLLHLVGCLDRPTSGVVEIDGMNLSRLTPNERARVRGEKIGFIFQSFHLIHNLSAVENVELQLLLANSQRETARRTAHSVLAQVGMTSRADHRPVDMSGGEQQRVAIARALVNRPEIVLGDEPTGNLDSDTGRGILSLLEALRHEGTTAVVVTHNPEIAVHGDMKVLLRDGKRIDESARAGGEP